VRRERDERRGFRDVPDDPDPFEAEAVRDGGARALEHRTGAELAARERPRESVEGFELDVRLAGYDVSWEVNCGPQSQFSLSR
jgi:hypothetical protein